MGTWNVKMKVYYSSQIADFFKSHSKLDNPGYEHLSWSFADYTWEEKMSCTSQKHWRSVGTYFNKRRVQMKVTSDSIQGQLCFFQVMLHPVLKMHTTPLKESMQTQQHSRKKSEEQKRCFRIWIKCKCRMSRVKGSHWAEQSKYRSAFIQHLLRLGSAWPGTAPGSSADLCLTLAGKASPDLSSAWMNSRKNPT